MATTTDTYWTERNALVSAALALTPSSDDETAHPQTLRAVRYCEALEALAAFDERNGGAPVL